MKYHHSVPLTWLVVAFSFPIIVLLALTGLHAWRLTEGVEVVLPIGGYDPRNLLSGHYVTYQVIYHATKPVCEGLTNGESITLCLSQKNHHWQGQVILDTQAAPSCQAKLNGYCSNGRFLAGIEKFYIPEQYAKQLDQAVRAEKGELVIVVNPAGRATVKDLHLQGKSWRQWIIEEANEGQ